ncbi:hypothetical protein [uncultured Allobaculum sp.]|uniref:hypothetical protein n=1 Tax=uncultured Allobaculum sp. TaxID=1187017 RepID=UPI002582D432|nr:hypothetical protein [uncultured Allobaculum sp.]
MMTIAALIAGVTVGIIVGAFMMMLENRAEVEELQARLNASIPKIEVLKAINRNKLSGKKLHQKRKDKSNEYWNGGIDAVYFDLKEDLK